MTGPDWATERQVSDVNEEIMFASLFVEEDTNLLTMGGTDGFVYELELGTSDAGALIAMDFDTKEYAGPGEHVRKLFQWLKLDVDTQEESLTVELYVDDTLKRSFQIVDNRRQMLIPFPAACIGYAWRVRMTGQSDTVRPVIYGMAAIYQVLNAA